jgi:hypothetical protein
MVINSILFLTTGGTVGTVGATVLTGTSPPTLLLTIELNILGFIILF